MKKVLLLIALVIVFASGTAVVRIATKASPSWRMESTFIGFSNALPGFGGVAASQASSRSRTFPFEVIFPKMREVACREAGVWKQLAEPTAGRNGDSEHGNSAIA